MTTSTESISQAQGLCNALKMYQTANVPDLKGKGADMRSLAAALRKFVPGASSEDKQLLSAQLNFGRGNIVEGIWRELVGATQEHQPTQSTVPSVDKYQSLMDKLGVLQSQVEVLTTLVQGMAKTKVKPTAKV